MRESRNPFRLRRSENIDTDSTFLSLFEPGILEVLQDQGLPQTVRLIRSAAGGGKTSLLRLFTPSVLRKLHARRSEDADLFGRLQALGAIDESGPLLLGVMLLCGRNYAGLQDLPLDEPVRTRLFIGLLNARVILAVLRSALALRGLEYPRDVARVSLQAKPTDDVPQELQAASSGTALYSWAHDVEKQICAELDSFGPLKARSLPGHDALYALGLVHPDSLCVDGQPVAHRVVLMMDDIHMLTAPQRTLLVERVIEARSRVGIWIAERFEALNAHELLASGSGEGRDHEAPIELEWFWRRRHERFEKHVMRIADRRVRASTETELEGFRSCLEDSLDGPEYGPLFERAVGEIRERLRERIGQNAQFREWMDFRASEEGTPRHRALGWRALEIVVERELRRAQKGLFDDVVALSTDELTEKEDSPVKQAAELFLAREYGLPYYFGPDRVARLASLNIEQFLGMAGSVFEEVISAELLRDSSHVISARRQHALLKKAALAFWNDIPNRVRFGRELRAFLEAVGTFCSWYTYRPTAPNDPGVGGTALRMSERAVLLDGSGSALRPERQRFMNLLASALAHNYVVADLDYKCKGDRWMVLNLNRLLCVHFDLPLGYGLYKERPLDELCRWVTEPFVAPRREDSLV